MNMPIETRLIINELTAFKTKLNDIHVNEMLDILGMLKNVNYTHIKITKDYVFYKYHSWINIIQYAESDQMFFKLVPIKGIKTDNKFDTVSEWAMSHFEKRNKTYICRRTNLRFSFTEEDLGVIDSFLVKPNTPQKSLQF